MPIKYYTYQWRQGPKGLTVAEVSALGVIEEIDPAGGNTSLCDTLPVNEYVTVLVV